ncbi:melanocyte-stimulating hormone receptor-like isoform X2 [Stylophora pistillata]|uniref:melanocyte-stimulating hormone receptor-like isoform X2 n=1 Tax=Stylophora pistillata TaxID=50429 RepID=UPI000C03CA72|nr:melanocyte-stimulating hormone receptor-like isoform X2 [Stylophora pistillata]XP_022794283.1 melanocyte-stimulating hormone receptor-like isoform X2 [Stylophora pistillata]
MATTNIIGVHILLSVTAFLGNSLILVALNKETSLHPPSKLLYRCLATTDLLVGLVAQPLYATWIFLDPWTLEDWKIFAYVQNATNITGYLLGGVSLLTMTAISVDRLLALLLGLRYKQIVTLKRTFIIVATIWVSTLVASVCVIFDYHITILYSIIFTAICLVISITSYIKVFCVLHHHHAQVQDHSQQQPSQPNALNTARYRKAVYSALWTQSALVVCYAPHFVLRIIVRHSKTYPLHLQVIGEIAVVLVYFNSTLNPFLYCWKISEVRRAVKQTVRQALCYTWG